MYFIPRNNRFYSYIAHIKPWIRYSGTLVIASSIIILWLYGVYFRLEALIDQHTSQISHMRKQYEQLTQAQLACKQLEKSIFVLKQDREAFTSKGTIQDELQARALFVIQQAQEAGLALNSYNVTKSVKKSWCLKYPAHFEFSGAIKQMIMFLNKIESSGKMITCSNTKLSRQGGQVFTLQCDMNFLFIT